MQNNYDGKPAGYEIISQQFGVGCNDNDQFEINDFLGRLQWVYAMKTDDIQLTGTDLTAMTDDLGGAPIVAMLRSPHWPPNRVLPISPKDEFYLPDLIGRTVVISYEPVDHIAAVFFHSSQDLTDG